jgi:hypothetical protein
MAHVLFRSLRTLLVHEIKVAESRFLMGFEFEQNSRSFKLVRGGDGIVAGIENISRPISGELIIAELE